MSQPKIPSVKTFGFDGGDKISFVTCDTTVVDLTHLQAKQITCRSRFSRSSSASSSR